MKVKQSVAAGCLFLTASMIGCGLIVSNASGLVTSMEAKLTIRQPLSAKLWEFGTGGTVISSPAISNSEFSARGNEQNVMDFDRLSGVHSSRNLSPNISSSA